VRLFGSWAAGRATIHSDLDIAVVVDDLDRDERAAAIDDAADVEVAHGAVLGPYVVSTRHFEALAARGRALADAITYEGIAL
jgi:predicted nucleotidyltransferase